MELDQASSFTFTERTESLKERKVVSPRKFYVLFLCPPSYLHVHFSLISLISLRWAAD